MKDDPSMATQSSRLMLDSAVPIVGQPVTVLSYLVMPLVQCACGSAPMSLVVQWREGQGQGLPATCSACQNSYRIQSVSVDARGLLVFGIEVLRPVTV